ncbi:hypothetical protein GCM10028895_40260 [Pontibacter rugosus]
MNKFLFAVLAILLPLQLLAQYQLSGRISNAATGGGLTGATVVLERTGTGATTGAAGDFSFPNLPAGAYTLKISFLGFQEQKLNVNLQQDTNLNIILKQKAMQASEVLVQATRADERTGTTFTNVTREEIEERNFGQDLPYLLEQTPSVVVNSDAGGGVGYPASAFVALTLPASM